MNKKQVMQIIITLEFEGDDLAKNRLENDVSGAIEKLAADDFNTSVNITNWKYQVHVNPVIWTV